MRMKTSPLTETVTHPMHDGGTLTVSPDGTVVLAGSTFTIHRLRFEHGDGQVRQETHLVGSRGSSYLLRPYIERNGDTGIRQVVSLNTGAPWRKRGNEIRVIEIAGVIEAAN